MTAVAGCDIVVYGSLLEEDRDRTSFSIRNSY